MGGYETSKKRESVSGENKTFDDINFIWDPIEHSGKISISCLKYFAENGSTDVLQRHSVLGG